MCPNYSTIWGHPKVIYGLIQTAIPVTISVLSPSATARQIEDAVWHLYLQQTAQGLKPDKRYFSINTRYDKLPKKREYQYARCIIPATAFIESQQGSNPYLLAFKNNAIAFGGLYKVWLDKMTDEEHLSASIIITLPGHTKLKSIHEKAFPLILPNEQSTVIDPWLDPNFRHIEAFQDLLTPQLRYHVIATSIDRASTKVPIGRPMKTPADYP